MLDRAHEADCLLCHRQAHWLLDDKTGVYGCIARPSIFFGYMLPQ